jgi:putative copper resistance protein D
MIGLVVISARLAQFACAMVLFGSPLFFLYGFPQRGVGAAQKLTWPRRFLGGAALVLLISTLVALFAQTAVMADSVAEAFKPDTLAAVLTDGQFGVAILARLALTLLALLALVLSKPSIGLWLTATVLGAGIVASFAWTGHGAADEGAGGALHLVSDVLHLGAAAVWLGALAAFAIVLFQSRQAVLQAELVALHRALEKFSGIGSAVVAILLGTGLVNSWFLVGPSHIADLIRTSYGLLLLAKLGLFAAMLGLAAVNRFMLTPRFGGALASDAPTATAISALRRSVVIETSVAFLVLTLVSVLGTLSPPAAH